MHKTLFAALLTAHIAFAQENATNTTTLEGTIINEDLSLPSDGKPVYSIVLRQNSGEETTVHIHLCPKDAYSFLNLRDYIKIETSEIQNLLHLEINKPAILWK